MAIRKLILLVAGHGNGDPGATGQGSTEANETIQLVNRVYDLLAPHPNIVVEHDPFELDYEASTSWINANYKNLEDCIVVEIHKNAFNGQASGNEVLVPGGADAVSRSMASKILNAMTVTTNLPNRGVKERGDLLLINAVNPYAILIEAGFIDHDPIDDSADAAFALGIANGLCDFFDEARPNTPVTPPVVVPPVVKLPVITTETVTVKSTTPFKVTRVEDPTKTGTTVAIGTVGIKTIVYKVTYTDGKETKREQVGENTIAPIDEVVTVGTYVAPVPNLDVENSTMLKNIDAKLETVKAIVNQILKLITDFFGKFKS